MMDFQYNYNKYYIKLIIKIKIDLYSTVTNKKYGLDVHSKTE